MISRFQLFCLLALVLLGLSPAAEEKRLAVYTPQTGFTIPVIDHDSHEYVSVTDLLDPFGQATLKKDGKRWRLRFEASGKTTEAEFTDGSSDTKVRGKKIALRHPFWSDNQRGFIPVNATPTVLSQFIGGSSYLKENSRRLFVGDVATTFTAELQKDNPSRLLLHFSAPVNPSVATEPGRVRLTFLREPLVVGAQNPQTFDDPSIRSSAFSENNGASEIAIATAVPVITTFGDGNKTITISPIPVQAATPPPQTAPPVVTPAPSTAQTAPPATAPAAPRFLVMIDPAHGGTDPGAALGGGLFEKDVTMAIAHRIRNELDQRGIATVMLREGDSTFTLDQRATIANASRAAIYIAVHADTLGFGVRTYTARLSAPVITPANGFLPWNSAQATYLDQSHNLAASLITEFDSRQIHAVPLESGLRPLRNLAKPAIAIEVAPPEGSIEGLTSAIYQQSVASAVAAGIANLRGSLEKAQ